MEGVLTGRELVNKILTTVVNLDLPVVTEDDEEIIGISERIWGPDEIMLAGANLRGSIILKTRRRDGADS